jgi:hypothetical protein
MTGGPSHFHNAPGIFKIPGVFGMYFVSQKAVSRVIMGLRTGRKAFKEALPMNRWFTTADENAATGGVTGFVGAFSLEV